MGDLELFMSKSALANIARCDALHDAVLELASVINAISTTDAERKEFAHDARWMLREIIREGEDE
jgi:hypothetical protein